MRLTSKLVGAGALLIAALASSLPARAQVFYIEGDEGEFGTVNVATGTYKRIALTEYNSTAIALEGIFVGYNGTLYGVGTLGNNIPALYSVNTTTGALTRIGLTADIRMTGLVETASGAYYTENETIGGTSPTDNLYTLNITNGTPTLVGNMGTASDGGFGIGPNNTMYLTTGDDHSGYFDSVNATSGQATVINTNSGFTTPYAIGSDNGEMFAFAQNGRIYTVNDTTGVAAFTGFTLNTGTVGIPFAVARVAPGPPSLAILAFGIGPLMGLARARGRTRRTSQSMRAAV